MKVMMQSPQWGTMSQEERQVVLERHEGHEREVRGTAGLCLETLNMLNYLTSDEVSKKKQINLLILICYAL
jgi:hypothetical protein